MPDNLFTGPLFKMRSLNLPFPGGERWLGLRSVAATPYQCVTLDAIVLVEYLPQHDDQITNW